MQGAKPLLEHLYDRFNARDVAAALATRHEEVTWANGMEGGHVRGHDEVRSYWTRQWSIIDPRVEPVEFSTGPDGEVIVNVHQTVRDLAGKLIVDKFVRHRFRFESGLIKRFDIIAG
jgi:hypothetical protein